MKATKFLGISMERRSRRRLLVVCTYLFLCAVMGAALFVKGGRLLRPGDGLGAFNLMFIILFTGLSRVVFGSLVRQSTLPVPEPEELQARGTPSLFHSEKYSEALPDERELAVRNWAYFFSFRFVTVYMIALWLGYAALNAMGRAMISLNVFGLLMFPALVMAFTLPQALILWIEPDVPLEQAEDMLPASSR